MGTQLNLPHTEREKGELLKRIAKLAEDADKELQTYYPQLEAVLAKHVMAYIDSALEHIREIERLALEEERLLQLLRRS